MLEVIIDLTLDTLQYHNKSLPLTIAIILVTEVGNMSISLIVNWLLPILWAKLHKVLIINEFQSAGVVI